MIPTPGTESATGLDRWSPELRRAVMVARPEYFAWSAEEQLRYRVKLPDDGFAVLVRQLHAIPKLLFGRPGEELRPSDHDGTAQFGRPPVEAGGGFGAGCGSHEVILSWRVRTGCLLLGERLVGVDNASTGKQVN